MRKFRTEKRINKITNVVKSRQHSLMVVLENIHDPHNVSAIYRTCDAVGVPKVGLVYTNEIFPKISKFTSASARKWVDTIKFSGVDDCYNSLRNEGFRIYATMLDRKAKSIYDVDFTSKSVIVMGNEHRGVSDEAAEKSDETVFIPMHGMIQSLNVSVATAVTLFEAQRQRQQNGMYDNSELSDETIEKMIDEWAEK
jgi:tRNA (guanosine-2'-O-)-methyltransferase